ncbi:MAG: M15 family metallopeptidase [Eubacteriales bacterium]|nr:M15 family metallopeptidase [Eubacteriales bacterium]
MNFGKNRRKNILFLTLMLISMVWLGMSSMATAASRPAQVKKVRVTAYGSTSHLIKWKKVSGATGYQIYCKDYTSSEKVFRKVKTIRGASNKKAIIENRQQGKAYAYIVRAYRKTSAGVSYGKLSAPAYGFIKKEAQAEISTQPVTTATDILISPSKAQKYDKIFGNASLSLRYPGGYYKNSTAAAANMQEITVRTWDFKSGRSGEKITRTWTIKVHKNLASTVQQIFEEIYSGSEQFPIHELGGYAWRGGHSEHNTGTAVDINWTENYMVNVKTVAITAGKYWKPGEDPYSIPKDGEVARIFAKYGFSQGDWGNSKDYMHFSYFGT